jgi:hypothetical protein
MNSIAQLTEQLLQGEWTVNKGQAKIDRERLAARGKKRCTNCRGIKNLDDFSANAQNPDGLAYYCRRCNAEKQRDWKHAHPEEVKAMRK